MASSSQSGATQSGMVRSMTGQGHAQSQSDLGTVKVEIRSVNHRGLKCSIRTNEPLAALESQIESFARTSMHRGSVQINVHWRRPEGDTPQRIDEAVLSNYYAQCVRAHQSQGGQGNIDITNLVALPGVLISEAVDDEDNREVIWTQVRDTLDAAIANLNQLRDAEGENMVISLRNDCQSITDHLSEVAAMAPQAVENYRERLESKVKKTLEKHELDVQTIDLLREVQIYADKADISEEITRLGSHLQLFVDVMHGKHAEKEQNQQGAPEPTGRKLDFIIQEMFRETNTIGSKANHAGISANVVEIKCAIERMRELVQNLE